MTVYSWEYGSIAVGLEFTIVYDSATNKFTVSVATGAVDINALWFSSGDTTSDGYTLLKSDNNLNLNGTSTVWEDDGTSSTAKFVWDGYLKEGTSTIVSAGQPLVFDAGDFDPEIYGILGVRATTATGSIKWVDEQAQVNNAPTLTVDNTSVDLAFDAAAGQIVGADADATDAEGDAVSYILVGTVPDDGQGGVLFSINSSDGQISLTTAGAAYLGKMGSFRDYSVSVQATAGGMSSDVETIVIKVAPPAGSVLLFDDSGEFVSAHSTIQLAINAAGVSGYTVMAKSGTYNDSININKSVTLIGANAGIEGDAFRGAESEISGKITVDTAATIDGFKIVNSTANTTAYDAVRVQTLGEVTIKNNVFYSTGPNGSNTTIDRGVYLTTAATGKVTVEDNFFTGTQTNNFGDANWTSAVWSDGNSSDLEITDNTFNYVRTAMNLDGYVASKVEVSFNNILQAGTGISVGGNAVGTALTFAGIHDNTFNVVGTDFNFQNIGAAKTVSINLDATNNLTVSGQLMTVLLGGGGDTMTGTNGSDVITGNAGSDNLTGLLGADSFLFNRALGLTNIDRIMDFSGSGGDGDQFWLDDAIFIGLTNATLEADFGTKILYDSGSGALSFDQDGAGFGTAVQFAALGTGLNITAADFLIY